MSLFMRRNRCVGAAVILGLTAAIAAQSRATVVTLSPSADVFLSASNPNNNYGSAGALAVAASGLSKGQFDSLMKFDVSNVKSTFDAALGAGAWSIQSMTLQLTAAAPNNAIFNGNQAGPGNTNVNTAGQFAVDYFGDDSWIEGNGTPMTTTNNNTIPGAVTFATEPSNASDQSLGTFSFNGNTSGAQIYSLGISSGERTDIAAASASNPISLRLVAADSSIAYLFNSQNFGTASARPTLSITATAAVPEPAAATAMLLLSGGAVLYRRRRGL
jgi:hypothetical protein